MKEKKNIDRLFQEKFKDFEAAPSDAVWQGILAKQQKKKSRVIPLWLRVAGVAAVIAVLFGLGSLFFPKDDFQAPSPQLVEQDANDGKKFIDTSDVVNSQFVIIDEAGENVDETSAREQSPKETQTASTSKNALPNKRGVRGEDDNDFIDNASAKAITEKSTDGKNPLTKGKDTHVVANNAFGESQETKNNLTSNKKEAVAAVEGGNEEAKEEEKTLPDLVEEMKQQEEGIAGVDDKEGKLKRWGIAPNLAPVYYGSFGGNGVAPEFNDNSSQGDVNLSYGVQVSYAVNERFTIRSGVNKVDLSYRTGNVAFSPGFSAHAISSINYSRDNSIEVMNVRSSSALLSPSSSGTFAEVGQPSTVSSAVLDQRLGYLEVPLEMEYALVDKKIGVNLIGGVSTLFLSDNEIRLVDGDQSSVLGESNSLNNTSFSTNVGVGLDYEMTKSIKLNLEPMFKYQLNAYKNSVSDFKPYYLGLYTGVSIKF
ncbi:MAG: hypothetical protein CL868_06895 [Cytophagaceae bacterium]|mgnify:FL=1|nr:hypothetical protein [Cytophagaceae bacterium]